MVVSLHTGEQSRSPQGFPVPHAHAARAGVDGRAEQGVVAGIRVVRMGAHTAGADVVGAAVAVVRTRAARRVGGRQACAGPVADLGHVALTGRRRTANCSEIGEFVGVADTCALLAGGRVASLRRYRLAYRSPHHRCNRHLRDRPSPAPGSCACSTRTRRKHSRLLLQSPAVSHGSLAGLPPQYRGTAGITLLAAGDYAVATRPARHGRAGTENQEQRSTERAPNRNTHRTPPTKRNAARAYAFTRNPADGRPPPIHVKNTAGGGRRTTQCVHIRCGFPSCKARP